MPNLEACRWNSSVGGLWRWLTHIDTPVLLLPRTAGASAKNSALGAYSVRDIHKQSAVECAPCSLLF